MGQGPSLKVIKIHWTGRWWNRRMWGSLLLISISRIYVQMEQFSQSTYWTLMKDFEHIKGQKKSSSNWVGWKGGGERNQKRDQQLWKEVEGEGRSLHLEKSHSGEISWDRKGDQRSWDSLRKTGQSKNCSHGLCGHVSSVHPSLSHEAPVMERGWVLESGFWSMDQGGNCCGKTA